MPDRIGPGGTAAENTTYYRNVGQRQPGAAVHDKIIRELRREDLLSDK